MTSNVVPGLDPPAYVENRWDYDRQNEALAACPDCRCFPCALLYYLPKFVPRVQGLVAGTNVCSGCCHRGLIMVWVQFMVEFQNVYFSGLKINVTNVGHQLSLPKHKVPKCAAAFAWEVFPAHPGEPDCPGEDVVLDSTPDVTTSTNDDGTAETAALSDDNMTDVE